MLVVVVQRRGTRHRWGGREGQTEDPEAVLRDWGGEGGSRGDDLESPSVQSLVLTGCVSQSQAKARAIQGLRKQLVWVSVRWAGRGHGPRLSHSPGGVVSGWE